MRPIVTGLKATLNDNPHRSTPNLRLKFAGTAKQVTKLGGYQKHYVPDFPPSVLSVNAAQDAPVDLHCQMTAATSGQNKGADNQGSFGPWDCAVKWPRPGDALRKDIVEQVRAFDIRASES